MPTKGRIVPQKPEMRRPFVPRTVEKAERGMWRKTGLMEGGEDAEFPSRCGDSRSSHVSVCSLARSTVVIPTKSRTVPIDSADFPARSDSPPLFSWLQDGSGTRKSQIDEQTSEGGGRE